MSPRSLMLLAARLTPWRGSRYRIVEMRRDGSRRPCNAIWGDCNSAARDACRRWACNQDRGITAFAVSDGASLVFMAPSNRMYQEV